MPVVADISVNGNPSIYMLKQRFWSNSVYLGILSVDAFIDGGPYALHTGTTRRIVDMFDSAADAFL